MIKNTRHGLTVKGDVPSLLTEYTIITRGLIDSFEEAKMPRDVAVSFVTSAFELGKMSKEEFEERTTGILKKMMEDKHGENDEHHEES